MKIIHVLFAGVAVAVLGDVFLLTKNRMDEAEWATFRDSHHCVPVGNTDGSNRAGYQCDDGKIYYRWRQMR